MDARDRTLELLKQVGAKLVRTGKHLVYDLPNGRSFTMSKTPSDYRSDLNNYFQLKRALGLQLTKDEDLDINPVQVQRERKKEQQEGKETSGAGIFHDAPDPKTFIHLHEERERPAHYAGTKDLTIHVPVKRKQRGQLVQLHSDVFHYSPEVIAHADFLLKSEGKQASDDYLRRARQMSENDKLHPAQEVAPQPAQPQAFTGAASIEQALKEAQTKVRFFKQQISLAQVELERWSGIATSLDSVLKTATGTARVGHETTNKRHNWRANIVMAFKERGMAHMTRKMLRSLLEAKTSETQAAAIQTAISNSEKTGLLVNVDGLYMLDEKKANELGL